MNTDEMTHAEFVAYMHELEIIPDRREKARGLVRVGDAWVSQETASEIAEDLS